MVDVNEYFEGNVKSFVVNSSKGKRTVGVMAPGEYEFDTNTKETMTVVSGTISVWFPDEDDWEEFDEGASFEVDANSKFKVKVTEDTAYLCEYA